MDWDTDLQLLVMKTWVLCSPHSLGVVLSQGHGEYILLGNTSVEEGGSAPSPDRQSRGKQWLLLEDWAGPATGRADLTALQVLGLRGDSQSRAVGKEGSVCPRYPRCVGSASRSPKPAEPKTCQL